MPNINTAAINLKNACNFLINLLKKRPSHRFRVYMVQILIFQIILMPLMLTLNMFFYGEVLSVLTNFSEFNECLLYPEARLHCSVLQIYNSSSSSSSSGNAHFCASIKSRSNCCCCTSSILTSGGCRAGISTNSRSFLPLSFRANHKNGFSKL